MASLEELAHELAAVLSAAEAEGKIRRPYEIELVAGDDDLLGIFQVGSDGQWNTTMPDRAIDNAALPITVSVEDAEGRRYGMVWSPARPI